MNPLIDLLSEKIKTMPQGQIPIILEKIKSDDIATDNKSEMENQTLASTQKHNLFEEVRHQVCLIKAQCDELLALLNSNSGEKKFSLLPPSLTATEVGQGNVIEGVFNGQQMIGEDGKEYSIPPNYASKSKLVEGDLLKLTITPRGAFVYKQIGPIPRKRIIGELILDPVTAHWGVAVEGRVYSILSASVTFYKGKSEDEVIILVPEDGQSNWGAVENIIKK